MQFISNLSLPPCLPPGPTCPNILWKYSKHGYFLDLRYYLWTTSGESLVDEGKPKTSNGYSGLRNVTQLQSHLPQATSHPSLCTCPNGFILWVTSAVGLICLSESSSILLHTKKQFFSIPAGSAESFSREAKEERERQHKAISISMKTLA